GDVLTVTSEKDGFLWVPRLNGWAPKEDTLDVKDAVQLFSATIKEKPSAQAWHHRAKAWYALGRYQKAIDDFDQAIAIARTKRLSDRSDDKDRMVSLQINRANAYRELGKADRAIQGYTSALSLAPRNVIALSNRGLLLKDTGKLDAAMFDLNAAIRIRPDYPEARNHRGNTYWKQGKPEQAERDYKRAAKLRPGYPEPYFNLAAVARGRQEYKESLAYLKKAVSLDPNYTAALNDLAWLLATCSDTSLRDGKLAVKHATRACQLTKLKNANTIDTLAAALAENGDFSEAVKRVEQAIRLSNEESKPLMTVRKNLYLTKQAYVDRN
ncbi:MAG: tetratricopeptide repeat protein, partial [Planctomycetaceae bacterium]